MLLPPYAIMVLILGALAALAPISIDIYLPAFSSIEKSFQTTPHLVQITLGFYMVTYAVTTLFHGTLSDSFGRRKVIIGSLILYLVASIVCSLAPSIHWLIFGRVLQGLSAGAGRVVGQAIVADCYKGAQAQKTMSYIVMVFGVSPALAPIIGGYLAAGLGWRAIFVFLAIFSGLLMMMSWRYLPETLALKQKQPFKLSSLLNNYWKICSHRKFLVLSLSFATFYAGYGFVIGSAPDFIMNVLGLPETKFGYLFVPLVTGMVGGALIASRLASFVSGKNLMMAGITIMIASCITNVIYVMCFELVLPFAVIFYALFSFGMAIASPAMTLKILALQPEMTGMAASVLGFMQAFFFSIMAGFATPLIFGSGLKMAIAVAFFAVLGSVGWVKGQKINSKAAQE